MRASQRIRRLSQDGSSRSAKKDRHVLILKSCKLSLAPKNNRLMIVPMKWLLFLLLIFGFVGCSQSPTRETVGLAIWREDFENSGNAIDPQNPSNRCHLFKGYDALDLPDVKVPEGKTLRLEMRMFAPVANVGKDVRLQIDYREVDPLGNLGGFRSMSQTISDPSEKWQTVIKHAVYKGPQEGGILWSKWDSVPIYVDDLTLSLVPLPSR